MHLGQSCLVDGREIVGIFDLDNASWAYKTREFLERAEREGRTVWLTGDLPRSFVVTEGKAGPSVYISPLSAAVLSGRAERGGFENLYSQPLDTVWAGLFPPGLRRSPLPGDSPPAEDFLAWRKNPSPIQHPPVMNTGSE